MCSKVSFCKLHEVRKQNVYLNPGVSVCTIRQIYRSDLNWLSPKQDEVSATFCDGARRLVVWRWEVKNLILLRCTPWISGLILECGGNREAAVQGAHIVLVAGVGGGVSH